MNPTIYYAYERDTGRYAGSGTPEIDTPTHGCTEVPVPDYDEEAGEVALWDEDAEAWTVITVDAGDDEVGEDDE